MPDERGDTQRAEFGHRPEGEDEGFRFGIVMSVGLSVVLFFGGIAAVVVLHLRADMNARMLALSIILPLLVYAAIVAFCTWTRADSAALPDIRCRRRRIGGGYGFPFRRPSPAAMAGDMVAEYVAGTFLRKLTEGLFSKAGVVYVMIGFLAPMALLVWVFTTYPFPHSYPEALRGLLFP